MVVTIKTSKYDVLTFFGFQSGLWFRSFYFVNECLYHYTSSLKKNSICNRQWWKLFCHQACPVDLIQAHFRVIITSTSCDTKCQRKVYIKVQGTNYKGKYFIMLHSWMGRTMAILLGSYNTLEALSCSLQLPYLVRGRHFPNIFNRVIHMFTSLKYILDSFSTILGITKEHVGGTPIFSILLAPASFASAYALRRSLENCAF